MKKFFFVSILSFLLTSCANFKEPEFRGVNGFDMGKIDGREITFTLKASIFNPNWYALKVKKSSVDVYLENQLIGKLFLEKKVKMKGKTENDVNVPLRVELADGAMFTILRYVSKESVNLRFSGKVKGGVFFISKKFPINETKTISGKDLRLGLPN